MASRAMMAAMGCGYLRRISREARAYANGRLIGREPLSTIRFARYKLAAIDSSYTSAEALNHSADGVGPQGRHDACVSGRTGHRTVVTERMLSAAQDYQQLAGGEGYRCGSPTNIAGQALPRFTSVHRLRRQQRSAQPAAHGVLPGPARGPVPQRLPGRLAAHGARRRGAAGGPDLPRRGHRAGTHGPGWPRHRLPVRDHPGPEVGRRDRCRPGRVRIAIEFLKSDIAGVAAEFRLLATGILAPTTKAWRSRTAYCPSPSLSTPRRDRGPGQGSVRNALVRQAVETVDPPGQIGCPRLDEMRPGPPHGRGSLSTKQIVPRAVPVRSINGAPT